METSESTEEQIVNISNDATEGQLKIRALNDELRVNGRGGQILLTLGVDGLDHDRKRQVMDAVRSYNSFSEDNDPYGEHDFGEVEIDTNSVMFKIDYYDLSGRFRSPDPADPARTMRIMTIMFSNDY
jgi:hypothetical protein